MTGGASLTSESELCRGLDLPVAPGDEALVDAVVLSLQVEDLQSLLACCHPGTCLNNNNHDNMMMLDEGDNGITTEPEEASRLFSRECLLCLAPLSDTATQLYCICICISQTRQM